MVGVFPEFLRDRDIDDNIGVEREDLEQQP